jgi:restriction system protein
MWDYPSSSTLLTRHYITSDSCIWCNKELLRFEPVHIEPQTSTRKLIAQLSICRYCGWWTVYRIFQRDHPRSAGLFECYEGAMGSLMELDLADISLPLSEVRQYLQARKDKVFDLNPRVFEELVGSVFKDHGWEVRVTAYSGDDGVDAILKSSCGHRTVGVQVRKHKNGKKVEAEQIRSLAGALILNRCTEGVFVTTSSYRKGAVKTADKYKGLGYPIRLLDCQKFFDALEIAQLQQFSLDEEFFWKKIFSKGAYIGSGVEKPFMQKENIYSREVISTVTVSSDLIDLRDEPMPSHFGAD